MPHMGKGSNNYVVYLFLTLEAQVTAPGAGNMSCAFQTRHIILAGVCWTLTFTTASPLPQMCVETQWPGSCEQVSPHPRTNVPDEILERFGRKFTTRNRPVTNTASCWFGVICGASEHKSKHLFTFTMRLSPPLYLKGNWIRWEFSFSLMRIFALLHPIIHPLNRNVHHSRGA